MLTLYSVLIISFFRFLTVFDAKSRSIFLLCTLSVFLFFSFFRPVDLGIDTPYYVDIYIQNSYLSFDEIIDSYVFGSEKDPFFYIFSWLLAKLGFNYQLWLGLISFIFCYSFIKVISKYSTSPLFSILIFLSFGYLSFSFSGLRQTLAIAFVFLSFSALIEKRIFSFILLVLIASLFHVTALIFLLALLPVFLKTLMSHFFVIIAGLVVPYFVNDLIRVALSFGPAAFAEYVLSEVRLNYTLVLINLCFYAFVLTKFNSLKSKFPTSLLLYQITALGFFFQSFSVVLAEFFRIALFFNISLIVLSSWVLGEFDRLLTRIVILALIFPCMIFLIFRTQF